MQAMSVLTVLFKATSHLRSHPTSSASKSSPQKFSHRLRRFLLLPSGNHSASEHDWSIATVSRVLQQEGILRNGLFI